MFKIHFGKEGHSLTQQDFDYLASKTDGFSGSDISGLVKQALMIPVSRIQKAQYFYINPNDQLFYPCQKGDPVRSDKEVFYFQGAVQTSLFDIPKGKIAIPTFTAVRFFVVV